VVVVEEVRRVSIRGSDSPQASGPITARRGRHFEVNAETLKLKKELRFSFSDSSFSFSAFQFFSFFLLGPPSCPPDGGVNGWRM
jgi:hypothetical protein